MVECGSVWRIEVTSSTIINVDELQEHIIKALEGDVEFERVLVEPLYEAIKLFKEEAEEK